MSFKFSQRVLFYSFFDSRDYFQNQRFLLDPDFQMKSLQNKFISIKTPPRGVSTEVEAKQQWLDSHWKFLPKPSGRTRPLVVRRTRLQGAAKDDWKFFFCQKPSSGSLADLVLVALPINGTITMFNLKFFFLKIFLLEYLKDFQSFGMLLSDLPLW